MLSQIDIMKSLGKSIAIYPFKEDNLKENSYNLTASEHAFATKDADVDGFSIKSGENCVVLKENKQQIVLLPHSTTLIVTEEILGVTSIGGTYHSKVGLVSIGLGHIGTMLGPNFCGHSLIAVHNISDDLIFVPVGDTFSSVVFHRLDTPFIERNATVNAHLDKFSRFGIKADTSSISEDWKTRINDVADKMKQSNAYVTYRKKMWRYRVNALKTYINTVNFITLFAVVCFFASPWIVGVLAEFDFINTEAAIKYHSFFYNIALSGVGVFTFQFLFSFLKRR